MFVVGCSRSGAALVQRMLASLTRVHSFPETSFFINGVGHVGRPVSALGLPRGRERWAVARFPASNRPPSVSGLDAVVAQIGFSVGGWMASSGSLMRSRKKLERMFGSRNRLSMSFTLDPSNGGAGGTGRPRYLGRVRVSRDWS